MYENVATLVCKRTLAREYGRVAFKERNMAWKSVVRASEVLDKGNVDVVSARW